MKYARKATGKSGVIALEQSFHGRTIGRARRDGSALEARPVRALEAGATFVPPNDVAGPSRRDVGRRSASCCSSRCSAREGSSPSSRSSSPGPRGELGRAARIRRGADGRRPDGNVLRVRAARRHARSRHARESPRQRAPDRLSARRRCCGGRVRARRPRLDLRRQPRLVRRRRRRVRDGRRRPAGRGARERRASARRARRGLPHVVDVRGPRSARRRRAGCPRPVRSSMRRSMPGWSV